MAPKIPARLSMVGFPEADSMRCRLLLGVPVFAANVSKPTVALTRSRRMLRVTSGSSLRNSVAASSNIALANAGSRPARSAMKRLKSRFVVFTCYDLKIKVDLACALSKS